MSEAYIDIMLQSLKKKEEVLNKIILINKDQKLSLEDENAGPDRFDETVEQKSVLIEQLDQLDSGFEKLFERMKEELDGNKDKYAKQIKEMQKYIKSVTDKSMEIQAQEARNKELMMKKFANIKSKAKSVRQSSNIANKYYQNMNKINLVDPQFMDNNG